MYTSVFREWKVAAVFVAGICLFVGAYFAEGGGYESLNFKRQDEPKVEAAPVAAAPAKPAAPSATHFTSDEELAAAFAEPSEAAPTPAAAPDAGAAAADGGSPSPAGEAAPVPAAPVSAPVQQAP